MKRSIWFRSSALPGALVLAFLLASCEQNSMNPVESNLGGDNLVKQSSSGAPVPAEGNSHVLPPRAHAYGKSLAQWSAEWWEWAMSLPLAGHPFIDDPSFQVTTGQAGKVWFLAGVFGAPVQRTCTIPPGKALCIGVLNTEASDLEGLGKTEAQRRDSATYYENFLQDPFFTVDGVPVGNIGDYRVVSPQFTFTAPTPWIFGSTGGNGTSVGDGIFVMVTPLSAGQHTLHFGGRFHFPVGVYYGNAAPLDLPIDMTYNLTVARPNSGGSGK